MPRIDIRSGLQDGRLSEQPPGKRIRFHIPPSTIKAYALTTLVLAISVFISLRLNNWHWFSRSGAIIVVIGIILTSHQIIDNQRRLKIRRSHIAHQFTRDFANDLATHRLTSASVHEEDVWQDGIKGFYLLITGTLIWGFGDLIGLLTV